MTQYSITGKKAGDEFSSVYEGRNLSFAESDLVHPVHADGFVDGGDPVVVGNIVGVAETSASAATDIVAIDTEGIWCLSVAATDAAGNSAVVAGDEIFINTTTAVLSKNANKAISQRFGYALSGVGAGLTGLCAVKVHWNPDDALDKVGTSAAPLSIGTLPIAREFRYSSTATTGNVRGEYVALSLTASGVSGEAVRSWTNVESATVATAHGLHAGVEFDADGAVTGLAAGIRGTFLANNIAQTATICGGMSELYAGGAATDFGAATAHSIHRFVVAGDATGAATADNVFEFVGLSSTQYAANTDTPTMALRCIINGAVRYIMVSEAQS